VIALAGGGTVAARVSDDTDIGCGSEADAEQIQNRQLGEEPDDPTEQELESEEISQDEAAAEDGDDGDRGAYDSADASDDLNDEDAEDDFGDTTDSEFQDDEHDFEDSCPARWLRRGVQVREATPDPDQTGAELGEVEFLHGR
jgi:hypothetical protein